MAKCSLRFAGLWFGFAAAGASAAPDLDYRNPVAGEQLELFVGHASAYSDVDIVAFADGKLFFQTFKNTDASGSARLVVDLPAELVGARYSITATERSGVSIGSIAIRIVAPSLLLTGVEGGNAVIHRIPFVPNVRGESSPLRIRDATTTVLGVQKPGGAVRDGHSTKTFVIANALGGELRVLDDEPDPSRPSTSIFLGTELRGIAVSPDGRTVLVTAAGAPGANGELILLSTTDPSLRTRIDLGYPLGESGGRNIVVSEDGTRAFVALDGAFLRDVNLVALETGSKLIAVGTPGRDRIRDLRIVGDRLVALTGHSDANAPAGAISGVDISNPQRAGYYKTTSREPAIDLGRTQDGRLALFVLNGVALDGAFGEVTVIDVATMSLRGAPFKVPLGADALLLTPNPNSTRAALLYGAATDAATLLPFDLGTGALGKPHSLGYAAREIAVNGHSALVDLFFLVDGGGRLRVLRSDDLIESALPITIDELAAISIAQ